MSEITELTFGQKAVGLKFNHAEGETHDEVHNIKMEYAHIIDTLNDKRTAEMKSEQPDGGKIRHLATAITDAETAQMRAVKALTWETN
jgi:hypothetical protein